MPIGRYINLKLPSYDYFLDWELFADKDKKKVESSFDFDCDCKKVLKEYDDFEEVYNYHSLLVQSMPILRHQFNLVFR